MCNFKVGEKVVCVDDVFNNPLHDVEVREGVKRPIKGQMYTIRDFDKTSTVAAIFLEEIVNPILNYSDCRSELSFRISRFRKLDHQFAKDVIKQICEEPIEAEDLTTV